MSDPVFITGASGFVGGKLTERLLVNGRRVRLLARRPMPEFEKAGAEIIRGDLDDGEALLRGCAGAATVFHVAGRVGIWGPAAKFFHVNVEGTRNVITACRAAGVPRLIYTSSPSVVYNGCDLAGVDESAPLCTQAPCAYPTSKAAAERLVSAVNSTTLATVALRPHLVWGPGDKNVIPRVVARARAGRLKIVGSGRNRVDLTHITNVVDAHLLAENSLQRQDGPAGGRAYFITNGEPVVMWDWINELLRGLGVPGIEGKISLRAASSAGAVMETLWRVLPLKGEPPITRFMAKEMATDHWFDISAARRDLGYSPRITMAAGTAELIAHYRAGHDA
jgi:2-alkyl-3-oxoalkanoate reductase